MFIPLFLAGCGKSSLYEKIYSKAFKNSSISCLHIKADPLTRYILMQNHYLRLLQKRDCPYLLIATAHYVKSCTSAKAKALGSDIDGYLRLELQKDGTPLYRLQQDFKGCLTSWVVSNLVEQMRRRIHFALPRR